MDSGGHEKGSTATKGDWRYPITTPNTPIAGKIVDYAYFAFTHPKFRMGLYGSAYALIGIGAIACSQEAYGSYQRWRNEWRQPEGHYPVGKSYPSKGGE